MGEEKKERKSKKKKCWNEIKSLTRTKAKQLNFIFERENTVVEWDEECSECCVQLTTGSVTTTTPIYSIVYTYNGIGIN